MGQVFFINKLVVIGVGLIGGSLAMALRKCGVVGRVVGMGRGRSNLDDALKMGAIDEFSSDLPSVFSGAEIVVIATPVCNIIDTLRKIVPFLDKGAVVTDVGSVKGPIADGAEAIIPQGIHFVPGHPVAGTENSGVNSAFPELFMKRRCILTPTYKTDKGALDFVARMWKEVGSEVTFMDPERHDIILSAVSHLPHVVVYSLVNAIEDMSMSDNGILEYSAGGFSDFTRIASSSPEMWRDICLLNKNSILLAMKSFKEVFDTLEEIIERGNPDELYARFAKAKDLRDTLKSL